MSKCILLSTRPQWVEKILNGIKKDEIRKGTALYKAINKLIEEQGVAPMLLYCTKDTSKGYLVEEKQYKDYSIKEYELETTNEIKGVNANRILNGKVVARFNAIAEKIYCIGRICGYQTETLYQEDILGKSCLLAFELDDYLQGKTGTAIHINDLEIFDKPKDISEFYGAFTHKRDERIFGNNAIELDKKYGGLRQSIKGGYEYTYPLTRAPQSWCYVEV